MQLNQPLTDDEIQELLAFLPSSTSEEGMDLEALHGLLTALVSGPEVVMPNEWLSFVMKGGRFQLKSKDEVERIVGLIMRLYNDIPATLDDGTFVPLLEEFDDEASWPLEAYMWAKGYLLGIEMRDDAWQPLLTSSDATLVMPMVALQAPDDDPVLGGLLDTPDKHRQMIEDMGGCAVGVYDYWLQRRSPKSQTEMGKILPFRKPESPN